MTGLIFVGTDHNFRVGPSTIALAIDADAEGSELVEWESGRALEADLEEVGSG